MKGIIKFCSVCFGCSKEEAEKWIVDIVNQNTNKSLLEVDDEYELEISGKRKKKETCKPHRGS